MKKIFFTQCELKKQTLTQICWIPTKYAISNKCIKLNTDNGWVVTKIYNSIDEEQIRTRSCEYKHHRRITDI